MYGSQNARRDKAEQASGGRRESGLDDNNEAQEQNPRRMSYVKPIIIMISWNVEWKRIHENHDESVERL
jgi:hypothetical protein